MASSAIEIYKIFNEIQQNQNFTENLQAVIKILSNKKNNAIFYETLDRIFLIIYKSYQPGMNAFTQIKEFIKALIDLTIKQKKEEISIKILNHYCIFFTLEPKKKTLKLISFYFLGLFITPVFKYPSYYHPDTLEKVKDSVLNALKAKMLSFQDAAIKLLKKVPQLQKEKEISERLEEMLLISPVNIKKEILSLMDLNQPSSNKIKLLLDMCDDESSEIRHFVFEKVNSLDNFSLINKKMKVKLLFIGLSDHNAKNKNQARIFLRKLMMQLGIIKNHIDKRKYSNSNVKEKENKENRNNKMEVDNDDGSNMEVSSSNKTEENKENKENIMENIPITIEDKIAAASNTHGGEFGNTPGKNQYINRENALTGFDLRTSPSRLFEELEVIENYNHPKYSHAFELITEAIVNILNEENLISFLKEILKNINNKRLKVSSMKNDFLNTQVNKNFGDLNDIEEVEEDGTESNSNSCFNDIFFLHLCAKHAYSINEQSSKSMLIQSLNNSTNKLKLIKNFFEDNIPNMISLAENINYFYQKDPNALIIHQLLLLCELCGNFSNDSGNKVLLEVLRNMLLDLKLDEKNIKLLKNIKQKRENQRKQMEKLNNNNNNKKIIKITLKTLKTLKAKEIIIK